MDLFSHGLLGFVLGQALRLDKNAQIVLIISSVVLDIDSISMIAGWHAWFQFHRGPMHSFFGATLVSMVITSAYAFLMHISARGFISMTLVCLGGSFIHILLDLLTPWSIAVLWPLSNARTAFDLTHFVDPIFLGVLLLGSVLMVYLKNDARTTQMIAIITVVLLVMNFGVRCHEKNIAIETVKELNVHINFEAISLPTVRPDRWWVVTKMSFEDGFNYEIFGVDSIGNRVLSNSTVKSLFIDYRGLVDPPIDSPQKAVAYSIRDKRIRAFVEISRLPAVKVTVSSDGSTWQVFWYDAFAQLSGGALRGIGIMAKVENSGRITVDFLTNYPF